ncbi:hypothetical protein [Gluconobacter oxydans]|uniref:Uncharacterized protein n=1 Tax=Gluconobacter oxydans NBRC 3293 TaxID=1315969 RepID=A0A829X597_GLUOY|nr:hypothetical protein [Gluconobacter oxydans]GEM18010.1 hypothetical protein NBRC3293_2507 [Gluconobacter oxydans NBRC 3293]
MSGRPDTEPTVYVAREKNGEITAVYADDNLMDVALAVADFIRSGRIVEHVPLAFARKALFTSMTVAEWKALDAEERG